MPEGDNNRLRKPLPPKLVRPRLHRAHRRQRLIRNLRQRLRHSMVWISAGPGFGKTVLASTYAESRKKPCLWYRIDHRDCQSATFFYYLRRAAIAAVGTKAADLPQLTPEYFHGLEVYARNFFERFFQLIEPDTLLVFDDCHELNGGTVTESLLTAGLEQAPQSLEILLIGRHPPDPAFTRLVANESLAIMEGEMLSLSPEEARAIARQRSNTRISPERVDAIYRETKGWAAGFTLSLERTASDESIPTLPSRHLFEYFSTEVLSGIDSHTRDILLKSAWLPRMPKTLLLRQCNDPMAAATIDELCRKNYFTSRILGCEPTYEYHPLFRDCLLRHALRHWPPARVEEIRRHTAALLIESGLYEEALELLVELADWSRVAGIIETQAPAWLAEGRGQAIESALNMMPEPEITRRPWLLFWQATCRLPFDLQTARKQFARAESLFREQGEHAGQLLSCASILESYFHARSAFHQLDAWIEKVETLLQAQPQLLQSPDIEARVTGAMFSAYMARRPDGPAFGKWIARAEHLMLHTDDELLKLGLATHLVAYYAWWTGDSTRAGAIVDAIEPGKQDAGTAPLKHIVWSGASAINRWSRLDFSGCITAAQNGLKIASGHGIHLWDFLLLAQCAWGAIFLGEESEAEAFLGRMAAALQPGHYLDASHYHFQRFILALRGNDTPAMEAHSRISLDYARLAGDPWAEGLGLVAHARACAARGDTCSARHLLDDATSRVRGEAGNTIRYAALLAHAEMSFDAGKPGAGLAELRRLMKFASRKNIVYSNWERDSIMADLCVRALENDIETDYVLRLIRLRRMTPREPPRHLDNWPWPIEVLTLGRFEILVEGKPLRFAGKSQKRPLALLKALVAMGGQNVPETRLADALWPDAEGDAAQQALATTLHRLRQLIGADAVHRQDGTLSLDPALCRADLWSCECHLDRAEDVIHTDPGAAYAAMQAALALYRGPFLDGGDDASWALAPRERLRNRLLRDLVATAESLQENNRTADAIDCHERGIALDELAEECYRGLMRCHLDNGHHASGLVAYRRCREALQRGLGISPSADTDALYQALQR